MFQSLGRNQFCIMLSNKAFQVHRLSYHFKLLLIFLKIDYQSVMHTQRNNILGKYRLILIKLLFSVCEVMHLKGIFLKRVLIQKNKWIKIFVGNLNKHQ